MNVRYTPLDTQKWKQLALLEHPCYYVTMSYVRLERVEPERNMLRFYIVLWAPTLWKTWGVACRWGRIGENPRGERLHEFDSRDHALRLAAEVIELRLSHGYVAR